jgi:hypothetical protein
MDMSGKTLQSSSKAKNRLSINTLRLGDEWDVTEELVAVKAIFWAILLNETMFDLTGPMSDVRCPMSDVRCPMSRQLFRDIFF